jgi:aspartate aminotransferase/aminotransferase
MTALGRSGIREIMDLAAGLDSVVHLEVGEPDFPTPPHVVEAVTSWLTMGAVKYTLSRGMASLREALVAKLAACNGLTVGADQVIVTPGGTTAVVAAMLAMVEPGDAVLVPDPGWPTFRMAVQLAGGRSVRYPLVAEDRYAPDLDALESLAPQARVLVVNNPSNPTGAVYDQATVEALAALAQRHDLLVISDEVYEDLVFDGCHVSTETYCDDRVVSTFSFSKSYAMTGWRVGYAAGPRVLIERMVHIQEALVACPSELGQRAALAALEGPQDVVADMRRSYRERWELVRPLLNQAGVLASEPRGTFYALVDVHALGDDTYAVARDLLVNHRVAVAPGETFGPRGRGLVRISLATSVDDLVRGVERIVQSLVAAANP